MLMMVRAAMRVAAVVGVRRGDDTDRVGIEERRGAVVQDDAVPRQPRSTRLRSFAVTRRSWNMNSATVASRRSERSTP